MVERVADGGPTHLRRGALGERVAEQYLRERGFRIAAKNWRAGRDELDLVAYDGGQRVFVEVRARQANAAAQGWRTLTARKKQALRRAALAYRRAHTQAPWRWDVIQVDLAGDAVVNVVHTTYATV